MIKLKLFLKNYKGHITSRIHRRRAVKPYFFKSEQKGLYLKHIKTKIIIALREPNIDEDF